LQDAVLDGAEAAGADLAGRADDRLLLGPLAKGRDPALVDLVAGDAGIPQRSDVGDDMRQARANRFAAVLLVAVEQLVVGDGVEDEQRAGMVEGRWQEGQTRQPPVFSR
jgi:hypothetical protein